MIPINKKKVTAIPKIHRGLSEDRPTLFECSSDWEKRACREAIGHVYEKEKARSRAEDRDANHSKTEQSRLIGNNAGNICWTPNARKSHEIIGRPGFFLRRCLPYAGAPVDALARDNMHPCQGYAPRCEIVLGP